MGDRPPPLGSGPPAVKALRDKENVMIIAILDQADESIETVLNNSCASQTHPAHPIRGFDDGDVEDDDFLDDEEDDDFGDDDDLDEDDDGLFDDDDDDEDLLDDD
jgi:hypothetical protein